MKPLLNKGLLFLLTAFVFAACRENSRPTREMIARLDLKRGNIIYCGPAGKEFGIVDFQVCSEEVKNDFNTAMEMLHSFEYDESEKVFAKVIDKSPECAMAYWGLAMCSFHPLWEPPTEANLKKGSQAIEIAVSITGKSEKESAYIKAVAAYYENWKNTDALTRNNNFEKAMERLHTTYPEDKEAAIFYALSMVAAGDPKDKTYSNQKKAGELLNTLYVSNPDHPGIIHYIIHTYDYPGIAYLGLPAARRYADVAPSSAHALHMPSHIFTRLGLWDDCIKSNSASVEAAKCYAESADIKGHWDEELHGLDYLVYAYLQKGNNHAAAVLLKYIGTIKEVFPVNFKEAYTFAASPARMALENKNWSGAAGLQLQPESFPWNNYPWQESIFHFARLLGAVHIGNIADAHAALAKMNTLYNILQKQKDLYKSNQVAIQIKMGEAWIAFAANKKTEALELMKTASAMEDSTSKHPVTPGEVLPARELYADMLLEMNKNSDALQAYEEVLNKSPNRFNSLYGAGLAASKSKNEKKAITYYEQLLAMADPGSDRPELSFARTWLSKHE